MMVRYFRLKLTPKKGLNGKLLRINLMGIFSILPLWN